MSRSLKYALCAALLFGAAPLAAQSLRDVPALPELSPGAVVQQQAGVTDFSITYSSPARRDREVWGTLVPYGELWRAGANSPTRFSASTAFSFGGTEVPAGEYSLFILPTESSLTFILNQDPQQRGWQQRDTALDVASAEVPLEDGPDRERLHFLFTDTSDEGTELTLEWAGKAASVPVTVDTATLVQANIDAALADAWRPHFQSARYLFSQGEHARAQELMATSIAIQETWWNQWFMAQIKAAQENYGEAREHATRAIALGAGDPVWEGFFGPQADATMAEWPEAQQNNRGRRNRR